MDPARYELQMKWAENVKAKAQKQKTEAELLDKPTFKPQLYTAQSNPKRIEGRAAELAEIAGASYVIRQQRAREEKARLEEKFNNLGKVAHKSRRAHPPDVLGSVPPASRSRSSSPEAISSIAKIALDPSDVDLSRVGPGKPSAVSSGGATSNNAAAGLASSNMTSLSPRQGDLSHNAQSPRNSPNSRPSSPRPSSPRTAAGGYAATGRNSGTGNVSPQSSARQPSDFAAGNFSNSQAFMSSNFSDEDDHVRAEQWRDQMYQQQQFLQQHLLPPDLRFNEEENLIDMIERERRSWHLERVKLVHCIHMQQVELMQRSIAAQEQAVEIAREFARTVDAFENRLLLVETNVQKEIMAIKSIADGLNSSISALNSGLGIQSHSSSANAASVSKSPPPATGQAPRTPSPFNHTSGVISPSVHASTTTDGAISHSLNPATETGGLALTARRLTSIEHGIETIINRLMALEQRPVVAPTPQVFSIPSPPKPINTTGMSVYSQSTSAFSGGGNLISRANIVPASHHNGAAGAPPAVASSAATISSVNSGGSAGPSSHPNSGSGDAQRPSGGPTQGLHGTSGANAGSMGGNSRKS